MKGIEIIASYIQELHSRKGFSFRQVGKRVNKSAGYVSDLVHAKLRIPRWSSIEEIVVALDGDVNEARAIYSIAKAASYLEGVELSVHSERLFMETFISFAASVFSHFSFAVGREVLDTAGKRWDIAFDFRKGRE